ncbi:MAG: DUF817 domain-containing protein [Hyphomicrobiales bacterium]|nr:DUF817 domain-containing protein [Hyphomicrobiales bacterium]
MSVFARFALYERLISHWATSQSPTIRVGYEFVRFGLKQAWACLFGGMMVALLLGSFFLYPQEFVLARYDFLSIAALLIQVGLIWSGLETRDEAFVIFLFHIVGTVMEVFKTYMGSWIYPEPSILRIGGVPLFAGFMYAAVGSYLVRVWRLFEFRFTSHPPFWAISILAVAVYVNFFTHHFTIDLRNAMFLIAAFLFGPCWVHFRVWKVHRRMPLLLGLTLVTLFIWFAENFGTYSRAWIYPSQTDAWSLVSPAKLGSWFLLMLISYVMVYGVKTLFKVDGPRKEMPGFQGP